MIIFPPESWDIKIKWNKDFTRVDIEYVENVRYARDLCPQIYNATLASTITYIADGFRNLGVEFSENIEVTNRVLSIKSKDGRIEIIADVPNGVIKLKMKEVSPIILQYLILNEFLFAPAIPYIYKAETGKSLLDVLKETCKSVEQ